MIKGIFALSFKTISIILSLLFVISSLLFIRLSIKPIDASFLIPMIEQKVDIPAELHYSSIEFDWDKKSWGPSLQINNTQWKDDKQNIYLGDISISLNLARLLKLDFRLEKITLKNLVIQGRKKGDKINFHVMSTNKNMDSRKIDISTLDYNHIYTMVKRLGVISIENITTFIHDEDINHIYQMPYLSLKLEAKDDYFQVLGYLDDNQTLFKKGGQVFMAIHKDNLSFSGKLLIEDFDAVAFKDYGPLYNQIKPYWPLEGSALATLESRFTGSLENINEIKDIKDIQTLLPLLANWRLYIHDIHLVFPDWPLNPTKIKEVKAEGAFNIADLSIAIQAAEVYANPRNPLYFPEVEAAFPIKEAKTLGFFDIQNMSLNLTHIQILTDQYDLQGSYKAQFKGGENKHSFSIQIPSMDIDDVLTLWPKTAGRQAWLWVKENIKKGKVQGIFSARIDYQPKENANNWPVHFNSILDLSDVVFNYHEKTPDIYAKHGQMKMHGDRISIVAPVLTSQNMAIYDSQLDFENLNNRHINMQLSLPIELPVQYVMSYLEYFNEDIWNNLPLSEENIEGTLNAAIGMNMPLRADSADFKEKSPIEKLGLYGTGQINNFKIKDLFEQHSLTSEDLLFELQPQKISFSGLVRYNTQNINLSYLDIYTIPQKQAWMINASTKASISEITKALPQTQQALNSIKAKGQIEASIISEENNLKAKLNLKDASFTIPGIQYVKAVGANSSLATDIKIDNNKIDLPNIHLEAKNLTIRARTQFINGEVKNIYFDNIKQNRGEFKGVYELGQNRDQLNLSGKIDLASQGLSLNTSSDNKNGNQKNLDVVFDFTQLWLDNNTILKNVKGTASVIKGKVNKAKLTSYIGKAQAQLLIEPNGNKRKVDITSSDGGAILRGLAINESIYGGRLHIKGEIDDTKQGQPFLGEANLKDFTVKNAPTLTHLFSILNLIQLDSSLKGNGLVFQEANMPFIVKDNKLYINNAKVLGSILNGTMNGWVSLNEKGDISLSGKVIPFTTISDTASKIPVLGAILTGVDKDGVFAADYKISGARNAPKVTSNPLTSIAPGVVRDFLGAVGGAISGEN